MFLFYALMVITSAQRIRNRKIIKLFLQYAFVNFCVNLRAGYYVDH